MPSVSHHLDSWTWSTVLPSSRLHTYNISRDKSADERCDFTIGRLEGEQILVGDKLHLPAALRHVGVRML
eukprot:4100106-Pyramimonas_sp.AAC.3